MHFGDHLSRSEYRGLSALAIILVLFTVGFWWATNHFANKHTSFAAADTAEEVHQFWDSIKKEQFQRNRYRANNIKPFPFDPNTTDSATFVKLGLPYWIAGRIIHYRRAGGFFKQPSDLRKIYGLSERDFKILLPYISIAPRTQAKISAKASDSLHTSAIHQGFHDMKFRQQIRLDLNRTDSATLLKIPGIGNYFAHRIVHYGKLLGGYADIKQLLEIKGISEEIVKWFYVKKTDVSKLHINQLPFRELLRHPYLNYEQVKAIFRYRQKFGQIRSLQDLSNYEAFSAEDFKRLAPYVSFD